MLWLALCLPLVAAMVAMQFTKEVNWGLVDFAAGAALLFTLGAVVEFVCHVSRRPRTRVIVIGAAALSVFVIWADAAVGVF